MDGAVAASVAAAVAASIAAISSAVAAVQTWRLANTESERRNEERAEAKRAWIIANYVSDRDSTWLQIQNIGPAVARHVALAIRPADASPDRSDLPSELAPFQVVGLPYQPLAHPPARTTVLSWVDADGRGRALVVPEFVLPLAAAMSLHDQRGMATRLTWDLS